MQSSQAGPRAAQLPQSMCRTPGSGGGAGVECHGELVMRTSLVGTSDSFGAPVGTSGSTESVGGDF